MSMTDDTRKALDITRPLADFCNVIITADERYLYINERNGICQMLPIQFNSTRATVKAILRYLTQAAETDDYQMWGCE